MFVGFPFQVVVGVQWKIGNCFSGPRGVKCATAEGWDRKRTPLTRRGWHLFLAPYLFRE